MFQLLPKKTVRATRWKTTSGAFLSSLALGLLLLTGGCQAADPAKTSPPGTPRVVAVESFLADIAQNIAGTRLTVATLIPLGLDPHEFEPAPQDVAKLADADLIIANGAGFESWLQKTITSAGGKAVVLETSAGLSFRKPGPGETPDPDHPGDPHFWLDPISAVHYAENIRDAFIQLDPAGKAAYTQNAAGYIARLTELDRWIKDQLAPIPAEKRLLVTNHESLGYFADRYGFRIVGTIIPSVTSGSAPSAKQLAELANLIRQTGVRAIFLETGSNPQLAEQLATETGIQVVSQLTTHSISTAGGSAPTYIDMIKFDVNQIVSGLK
jgi:ABC-type Zn uptake system ZnuABC Zn-binding protein ZnuA